jgi:hypothetical protein
MANSNPLENPDFVVLHEDGASDNDLPLGRYQDVANALIETQEICGEPEMTILGVAYVVDRIMHHSSPRG